MSAERRRLRRELRSRRRQVDGTERAAAEAAIAARLATLVRLQPARLHGGGVRAPQVVAGYLADDGEPAIGGSLELVDRRGGEVALPGLVNGAMDFRPWRPGAPMRTGEFQIVEPDTSTRIAADHLDVVFVPLVGFDSIGNRMGRGGGHYDRMFGPLQSAPQMPTLIGVAFECQRVPSLPCEAHDVPLDAVVTELGVRWNVPVRSAD